MAASTTKELLSKLKTSMPKVESSPDPLATLHQFPETLRKTPAPPTARAPKLSVSLYSRDIERLESIKEFMKSQGFRNLSDSEALRLACRNVQIDGDLINVYRSMQGEDGRRR